MKQFLGLILCSIAVHSREYHYNIPKVGFHQEDKPHNGPLAHHQILPQQTTVIKGNFGQNYEVTMTPSQKLFETRLIGNPQPAGSLAANPNNLQYQNHYSTINSPQQPGVLLNQYSAINPPPSSLVTNQPANAVSALNQPHLNVSPHNPTYGHLPQPNHQYSTINSPPSSLITNQYAGLNSNAVSSAPNQPFLSPPPFTSPNPAYYPTNGHFLQPHHQYSTINPQQSGVITNQYSGLNSNTGAFANAHQHLNQYSNQQQQNHPAGAIPIQYQQHQHQHQQYNNNNALNSPNLRNDHKYVSQSEASQLDVYPYKQSPIGNTRTFTRFTTNCYQGQCTQQQNGVDLQHQQVLQQSKAIIATISDKCKNTGNYGYSQNSLNSLNSQNTQKSQLSLTDAQMAAKRNFAKKGTYLKDRRQFAYTEQELPQYPDN